MFKRILLSTGSLALLALGACDSALENEIPCTPITSNVQATAGDTVITTSGLRYIETQVGAGAAVRSCRYVDVSLRGTLLDGTVFEPGETPIRFHPGTGDLIRGFEEGVLGMNVGGRRRLIIPPAIGFGSTARTDRNGNVIIPANSTVVFDVEVIRVEP